MYKPDQVLATESEQLVARRKRLFGDAVAANFTKNKFGIAMSGGGIRSATINLGILKTLNLFKILEKADYLSTVSGGGYTGAYVQATLKDNAAKAATASLGGSLKDKAYGQLFDEGKLEHLRNYGDYFIPGQSKLQKTWNTLILAIGFLVSWAMSLISPAAVVIFIYLVYKIIASFSPINDQGFFLNASNPANHIMAYLTPALVALGSVMAVHLVSNLWLNFGLNVSKIFNKIESLIAMFIVAFLAIVGFITLDLAGHWSNEEIWLAVLAAAGVFAAGFFLNPNALSFHRFYRKQLADAFLWRTNAFSNMPLKEVFYLDQPASNMQANQPEQLGCLAPYPLINTCLNLQNPGGDEKFKGAKASDYFLLSPLFCGSKLSNYVKTAEFPGYQKMTLPAALTISAAAVNPGMGIYSNKFLSILMTLFNARLGFWVNNPLARKRSTLPAWATYFVWWPTYFFKELLGKIGTTNRKLNISDGGHIENLAVYELLRRRCKLIIAVDAGADPTFSFADLENLSIRARNELGVDISFRPGEDPVDVIRPKASSGYAQKRFAIADLYKIWDEFIVTDDQGNAVQIVEKEIQDGQIVEVKTCLEALVNYFYSKGNADVLKFKVDLKAIRGKHLTDEQYNDCHKRAVAMVRQKLAGMENRKGSEKIKIGALVYIKSSVTPPRKLFVPEYNLESGKVEKNLQFDTFKYKIYHPEFPHESTADQFFDPVQWESYYQLGQFIATDILDLPKPPDEYKRGDRDISIEDLIAHFDEVKPLFAKEERLANLEDASTVSREVADEADLEIARPKSAQVPAQPAEAAPAKPVEVEIAEQMQYKI